MTTSKASFFKPFRVPLQSGSLLHLGSCLRGRTETLWSRSRPPLRHSALPWGWLFATILQALADFLGPNSGNSVFSGLEAPGPNSGNSVLLVIILSTTWLLILPAVFSCSGLGLPTSLYYYFWDLQYYSVLFPRSSFLSSMPSLYFCTSGHNTGASESNLPKC